MHCSTRLKKKNLFKPLIKIIQVLTVLYFFFFSFFYSRPHCALSHHLKLSHQALISPISLISSHLQATPSPSQPTFISLICQALISKPRCRRRRPSPLSSLSSVKLSFLSSLKLSSPSPRRCHPSPRLSPRSARSTSGQCSLFFCSEFFNCCFGIIFLGLVLFCGEKWCCPYVVLGKI